MEYADRPFNTRYIVREHTGHYRPELLRTHRTAKASWCYINRKACIDEFGPTSDWSKRDDLIMAGRCAPRRGIASCLEGAELWAQADANARLIRPEEPVAAHAVAALPRHASPEEWRNLIEGFCEDYTCALGMIADWAVHYREEAEGRRAIHPHVHILLTMRVFDRTLPEFGKVRKTWVRTENARKRLAERWWERSGIYPACYEFKAAA